MTPNEYAADAMDNASLRYAGSIDSGATDSEYTLPPYIYGTLAAMGNPPYHHQPERLVLETGTPGVVAHPHICAQHELIQALQEQIDALHRTIAQQGSDLDTLRSNVRHLQRSARILDRAFKAWREASRENDFWAYVMQAIGEENGQEAAK